MITITFTAGPGIDVPCVSRRCRCSFCSRVGQCSYRAISYREPSTLKRSARRGLAVQIGDRIVLIPPTLAGARLTRHLRGAVRTGHWPLNTRILRRGRGRAAFPKKRYLGQLAAAGGCARRPVCFLQAKKPASVCSHLTEGVSVIHFRPESSAVKWITGTLVPPGLPVHGSGDRTIRRLPADSVPRTPCGTRCGSMRQQPFCAPTGAFSQSRASWFRSFQGQPSEGHAPLHDLFALYTWSS
jgi:hypothetical protein